MYVPIRTGSECSTYWLQEIICVVLMDWLTSCRKMKPEIPATSSARNTKVKNMAYCRMHTEEVITHDLNWKRQLQLSYSITDQFEHPRAAAACSKAAEQAKNNDGGSGPDEDIWCIGALLRNQREIGLQTHLPPHTNSQQDHACELKSTETWDGLTQRPLWHKNVYRH